MLAQSDKGQKEIVMKAFKKDDPNLSIGCEIEISNKPEYDTYNKVKYYKLETPKKEFKKGYVQKLINFDSYAEYAKKCFALAVEIDKDKAVDIFGFILGSGARIVNIDKLLTNDESDKMLNEAGKKLQDTFDGELQKSPYNDSDIPF
jgi:hypothetical protein